MTPGSGLVRLVDSTGKRFDTSVVIGNPIHHGMSVAPELIRRHVKRFLGGHSFSLAPDYPEYK